LGKWNCVEVMSAQQRSSPPEDGVGRRTINERS
jgi:hypothetical protein